MNEESIDQWFHELKSKVMWMTITVDEFQAALVNYLTDLLRGYETDSSFDKETTVSAVNHYFKLMTEVQFNANYSLTIFRLVTGTDIHGRGMNTTHILEWLAANQPATSRYHDKPVMAVSLDTLVTTKWSSVVALFYQDILTELTRDDKHTWTEATKILVANLAIPTQEVVDIVHWLVARTVDATHTPIIPE